MIKIRLAIIAILILALVIPMSGCGSNELSNESGKDVMARMMKMIPQSAGDFYFYNIKAYKEKERLNDYYTRSKEESSADLLDFIDYWGHSDNMNLWIYEGNSKSDVLRSQSINLGNESSFYEYKGIKVVKGQNYWDNDAAIINDISILGYGDDLKQCIDVITDDAPSLYTRKEFREVLDHLPVGISMGLWDATGYSEKDIVEGESTVFTGDGFQTTYITLTKDGNFLERVEFEGLPSE